MKLDHDARSALCGACDRHPDCDDCFMLQAEKWENVYVLNPPRYKVVFAWV